jgi:hypothetical protein
MLDAHLPEWQSCDIQRLIAGAAKPGRIRRSIRPGWQFIAVST